MKKIILLTLGFGVANVFAYTTINLDNSNYTCNKVKITSNTTESTVQNNCNNYKVKYTQDVVGGDDGASPHNLQPIVPVVEPMSDDDVNNLARVRFTTDSGQKMECFYKNHKLYKCKISGTANKLPSSSSK